MATHLTYKTFPEVQFSALKFDGVRPGKNGMKFASLVNSTGRRVVIETPAMKIPWNTEIRKNEENGQCSSKIALSFQGMGDENDDGKLRRFFNFLNSVDNRVKELAVDNRADLWQKSMDATKVENVYQSSVKPSTSDKYPPTFQAKIPLEEAGDAISDDVSEGMKMKIVVFRKDKTLVSTSELKGGCLASVIAEAAYVWCTPMMIGISWIVKYVLVEPKPRENEFQFTDMEDFADADPGEKEDEESNKRKRSEEDEVEEDEDEEEEDEEEEDNF